LQAVTQIKAFALIECIIGQIPGLNGWSIAAMTRIPALAAARIAVAVSCVCGFVLATSPVFSAERECARPLTQIFKDVSPSVVFISTVNVNPFKVAGRARGGVGSGFLIDGEGRILTNAHVVHGATLIVVSTADGEGRKAEILGTDPVLDLAVLHVPGWASPPAPLELGSSAALEIGEEVTAIGNSLGLEQTVTRGIVSGLNRRLLESTISWLQPLIQTDAAINPGMSGGPLLDSCGNVVGINSMMITDAENIGFSVPIDMAKAVLAELIEKGRVSRPWHGVYGQIIEPLLLQQFGHPAPKGLLVETVEPGSPADKVGLRGGVIPVRFGFRLILMGGDIITKVNDTTLTDIDTVVEVVRSFKVGDKIRIEYYREGHRLAAEVTLPERPLLPGDTTRFEE
jgi:putative serine protease PepD